MGRWQFLTWVGFAVACRAEPGPNDWAAGDVGDGGAAASPSQTVPARDTPEGGAPGAGAHGATLDSEVPLAGAGTEPDASGCGAQPVTLGEIHSGRVKKGVAVALEALVASSQKFLVSEAKSGSCLWGALAADPARTGAGSGLFLVSFGAPHADGVACAPGSDGLPDDLQPGDGLQVEGMLDEYAPAACAGTAPSQQLRIDAACPARRGAARALPEPAVIDAALATRLAAGKDAQLLRDWGGALVRLEGVSALQDSDDGDAVFPFGVVRLEETPLEVHSRLYYFDLSEGGPRATGKAPRYRYPTAFRSVTGAVFLDYCSWVLAPRDRCSDLSPPSDGCSVQAPRP